MKHRYKLLKIAFGIAVINLGLLAHLPSASGTTPYIYFSLSDEPNFHSIGRADLDGTIIDEYWIEAGNPRWTDGQISVQGDYVYWANDVELIRDFKDGSDDPEVIYESLDPISSVTTDANYVYWSDVENEKIGRALLDGTSPNPNFISGTSPLNGNNDTYGLFVTNQHIYWANYGSNTIGRANLDGTNIDDDFVSLPINSGPCGVWASSTHLYWSNWDAGTIGSSNLDGSLINNSFIVGFGNFFNIFGTNTNIYWTDQGNNRIGRANLDGTGLNFDFISSLSLGPIGIWVDNDGAAVPSAPTLNSVTAGDRRVTIAFTAGANNGAAITDYEYSLNGGTYTSAGTTTSPFTITGLSGRTAYSVTIKARNSVGLSTASSALSATTTDASQDASEAAAGEAARLAAAKAAEEAARRAKEQKELTEILALIPSIGELTLSIGEITKSLYSTKCVKGKKTKYVKYGAKCPKGYKKK
jgi:hypothetical protein